MTIRTCNRGHASLDARNWKCPWCEIELLRGTIAADDERLKQAALRVWGEDRWGCDTAEQMADEIERLRARVAELEQERNEARSFLSTINSSDYSLALLVRELRATVEELEKNSMKEGK